MDAVLRAAATYVIILIIFRASGKRSLAEITTFDFVLLLIISETTQSALMGDNKSLTNTVILLITLIGLDISLSLLKERSRLIDRTIDSLPLVLLVDGAPLAERMKKSRVDEADILAAARTIHGLERLEQIKYAVLERNGGISIIPREIPPSRAPSAELPGQPAF
jgi:uncharacterized membrane protein YcaP (DUF421 family)